MIFKEQFYNRFSYTLGNEDPRSEITSLNIQPDDVVVCITASGDRPLNLLQNPCAKLFCIDANPMQTALFELKKTALEHLSYAGYLSFLGLKPSQIRLEVYEELKEFLTPTSSKIFDSHLRLIKKGIIYEGKIEKSLIRISNLLQFLFGRKIEDLFACQSIEKQKAFIEKNWPYSFVDKCFSLILHPSITKRVLKDPGLYEHLPHGLSVGKYLHKKLYYALTHFPVKEMILTSLIFKGQIFEDGYTPYLQKESFNAIRSNLQSIHLQTANILDFFASMPNDSIDCFALSDVASYLSDDQYHLFCKEILRTAKPNARFCLRQFLSQRTFPKELEGFYHQCLEQQEQLQNSERCFVYRFLVGTLKKS